MLPLLRVQGGRRAPRLRLSIFVARTESAPTDLRV